jgi:hypothetical protein
MNDETKALLKSLSPDERSELLTELGLDPAKLAKDHDVMITVEAILKRLDTIENRKSEKKAGLLDEFVRGFTGKKK